MPCCHPKRNSLDESTVLWPTAWSITNTDYHKSQGVPEHTQSIGLLVEREGQ